MHPSYHVSQSGKLVELATDSFDGDPLGLVLMWEAPKPGHEYFMGVFPSVGIVNWSRDWRVGDEHISNSVIEIVRVGKGKSPTVQVCEYAAPIHAEELADLANLLGRLYGVSEDDGQILCGIEVYPAPGLPVQNKLIHQYGYTNLPPWQYQDSMIPKNAAGSIGWFSTPKSLRDLWSRCAYLISKKAVVINSEWLVKELSNCILHPKLLYASATGTNKDDRVRAFNLALWYAHRFKINALTQETVEAGPGEQAIDFQCAGLTDSEYEDALEAKWAELVGE